MSSLPWIGLALAFVSALVTNAAYSLEHDVAASVPPLSPRRPLRSATLLLRDRRWLLAFAAAHGHPSRLAQRERYAAVLALAGLIMLAVSLMGVEPSDHHRAVLAISVWLAACAGRAALLIVVPWHFTRAASLGLATGLLFADGDISAKLVGHGGPWLIALITLIAGYAVGTTVLQSAYQHGDALTAAGTATMVANVVPIRSGKPAARPNRPLPQPAWSPRSSITPT
jgi:hypothetical protein